MDRGLPIAYALLDEGVPVFASDGTEMGAVAQVLAAPDQDIFHGIVVATGSERRVVEADHIASLHERGVDLRLSPQELAALPASLAVQPGR